MSAASRIIDYVIASSESAEESHRAALFRDLAELSADQGRASSLIALAADLDRRANEAAEIKRRCRQLRLDLGLDEGGRS